MYPVFTAKKDILTYFILVSIFIHIVTRIQKWPHYLLLESLTQRAEGRETSFSIHPPPKESRPHRTNSMSHRRAAARRENEGALSLSLTHISSEEIHVPGWHHPASPHGKFWTTGRVDGQSPTDSFLQSPGVEPHFSTEEKPTREVAPIFQDIFYREPKLDHIPESQ